MAKKKQTVTGADEWAHATPILSHGILQTDLFLVYFSSVKERQFRSCDAVTSIDFLSWHSLGSLIPGKFDLKINRSMKIQWSCMLLLMGS